MELLIKKANMDVLFEDKGNISNISIPIEPEMAMQINVGDEIEFRDCDFPKDSRTEQEMFNSKNSHWVKFSICHFWLKDFMAYYTKVHPGEHSMYLMVKRKIYTSGEHIHFIAKIQSPEEAQE